MKIFINNFEVLVLSVGSISVLQILPKSTPQSMGGKQDLCSLSDTLERVGVRFKELSTLIEMLPICQRRGQGNNEFSLVP
jgi:hypothetical protein